MTVPPTTAALAYYDQRVADYRLAMAASVLLAGGPTFASAATAELSEEFLASLRQFGNVYKQRTEVDSFQRTVVEVLVTRSVDNFNSYLADVFSVLFRARPEILKSSQKVEIGDVLECSSMDEVYAMFAARKVDELAYGGFKAVRKFLVERIGIDDIPNETLIAHAAEAIGARNVIVHNRGRVNERFLQEIGCTGQSIGEPVPLTIGDTIRFEKSLSDIVRHVDQALAQKFTLEVFSSAPRLPNER